MAQLWQRSVREVYAQFREPPVYEGAELRLFHEPLDEETVPVTDDHKEGEAEFASK